LISTPRILPKRKDIRKRETALAAAMRSALAEGDAVMTEIAFPPARPPLMEVVQVSDQPKLYRALWRDARWRVGFAAIWESASRLETLRRAWVMSGDFGGIPVVDATTAPARLYVGAAHRRRVRHGG
jgi:hypothetical protein